MYLVFIWYNTSLMIDDRLRLCFWNLRGMMKPSIGQNKEQGQKQAKKPLDLLVFKCQV